MTLKQMAAVRVAKMLALVTAVGVANSWLINEFGLAVVGTGWAVIVLVYMTKMVYDMEVDKLERLNSLKKIKESQQ